MLKAQAPVPSALIKSEEFVRSVHKVAALARLRIFAWVAMTPHSSGQKENAFVKLGRQTRQEQVVACVQLVNFGISQRNYVKTVQQIVTLALRLIHVRLAMHPIIWLMVSALVRDIWIVVSSVCRAVRHSTGTAVDAKIALLLIVLFVQIILGHAHRVWLHMSQSKAPANVQTLWYLKMEYVFSLAV